MAPGILDRLMMQDWLGRVKEMPRPKYIGFSAYCYFLMTG